MKSVAPLPDVFPYEMSEPVDDDMDTGIVYGPIVFERNSPLQTKMLDVMSPAVILFELISSQSKSPFSSVAIPSEMVIIPFILRLLIAVLVVELILYCNDIIFYGHSSNDKIKT